MEGRKGSKLGVIVVLGTTQTLAWASSYYLRAILADRIAHDLGISSTWFFAAFSGALVISAMVGPRVGRTVDAIGGREVLAFSNVVIAARLVTLAFAYSQADRALRCGCARCLVCFERGRPVGFVHVAHQERHRTIAAQLRAMPHHTVIVQVSKLTVAGHQAGPPLTRDHQNAYFTKPPW